MELAILDSRQAPHAPRIRQHRGSDAKADDVGQRIELHAKLGVRTRHARHAPVHRIENDRQPDGFGGMIEIIWPANKRCNRRIVTTQKIRSGEQARQKENSAPQPRILETALPERYLVLLAFRDHGLGWPADVKLASKFLAF